MSSEPFSRFPRAEYDRWRELAEAALAGAEFNRSLVGRDSAGLPTQPVYHAGMDGVEPAGEVARHQARRPWSILPELGAPEGNEARRVLEEAVEQGADALDLTPAWLPVPWKSGQTEWRDGDGLSALLGSLPLDRLTLWLDSRDLPLALAGLVYHALGQTGHEPGTLSVELFADPFMARLQDGAPRGGWERCWTQGKALLDWCASQAPAWGLFGADGQMWHECGLPAAEELALVLATLHAQLVGLCGAGADPAAVTHRFRLALACDREFFVTVAKFRAARLLVDQLLEGWGLPEDSRRLPLRARTSNREMCLADPWSNQLRLTGQLASAVCAGADTLTCGTWLDGVSRWQQGQPALPARDRRLARRLARTTPLLMRHEAFLDRVADPGGGAWFVEHQTRALAEAAWNRFQQIEKAGGLEAACAAGLPGEWCRQALADERLALSRGQRVLVGVNRYVDPDSALLPEGQAPARPGWDETAADTCCSLEEAFERAATEDWPGLVPALCGTAAPPVPGDALTPQPGARRVAEPYEALRRRAARLGKPVLAQVRFGAEAPLRARSEFVSQFLAAGGLGLQVTAADQPLDELFRDCPRHLLLCAADGDYPALLEQVLPLRDSLSPDTRLVLAGHPKALAAPLGDRARITGLEYIHLGADQLPRLEDLLAGLEGGHNA